MEYILNKIDLGSRNRIDQSVKSDKIHKNQKVQSLKKYGDDQKKDGNKKFMLKQDKEKRKNAVLAVDKKKEKSIEVESFKERNVKIGLGDYLDVRK